MEKLTLERDFSRFFDKEDFPHKVNVCFGERKFATCSGMVLAQQSAIIEQIICANKGVLTLNNMECYSIPEVMECLSFLYGADIALSLRNIGTALSFSSLYQIEDMFSLAFDWIIENVTVKNLIPLYEIPCNLSVRHKHLLLNVFNNFLADNLSDVMIEVRSHIIKERKSVCCEFVLSILQQSFSSCGDIVLAWITEEPFNVTFLLENMDLIDMNTHFPHSDDFTKLVSLLSANAESLQTMEKLIELQQNYFTKQCKLDPRTDSVDNKISFTSSVSEWKADEFYNFKDGQLHLHSHSDYMSIVCVPNIPVYATKGNVELAFSRVGPVKNVILIEIDCFNQLGFVSYENSCYAKESLSCDIFIHRHKLTVKSFIKPSPLNCREKRLFIKRIPMNSSKRDIERCFSLYGPIKDIEIIRHKKCAFIELIDTKVVAMLVHFAVNGVKFKVLGQNVSIEKFKTGKK